jgi:23S rRNA (guanosine2251-2'-O)-methyltransferase
VASEVVYGKHSVRAVFLARPRSVRRLLLLEGPLRYLGDFVSMAREAGIEPEVVDRRTLLGVGGLEGEEKHQGVVALVAPRGVGAERDLEGLRGAAFFGADAVVWLKNRAVDLSPTVTRWAVGGAELVDLYRVTNLSRSLDKLTELGFWTYGLDERGPRTLGETAFADKVALVVGAEGEGLRRRTKEHCDELVRIPGGRPGIESLNAGVAATVALAQVVAGRATPTGGTGEVTPAAG